MNEKSRFHSLSRNEHYRVVQQVSSGHFSPVYKLTMQRLEDKKAGGEAEVHASQSAQTADWWSCRTEVLEQLSFLFS
jgi:hypothetical protein